MLFQEVSTMADTQKKESNEFSELIRDSQELFYNIPPASSGAMPGVIMNSKKELTFHIWTQPESTMHAHENYLELFIVTSGKLLHQFGDHSTVMRAGDAFLMFPGQYHQHRQYKHYISQHINLTCSLPRAATMFKCLCGTDSPEILKQNIHFNDSEFNVVTDIKNLILRSKTDNYMNAAVQSLFSFALSFFCLPQTVTESPRALPKWMQQFLQELESIDFSTPIHMTDIYAMSGYSQSALSQQFKKYMGQTLVSYINDLKLNHACNQLKNTNFPLIDIAKSAGFESYPHFSRLFKSKFGLSPLQYRASSTSDKF